MTILEIKLLIGALGIITLAVVWIIWVAHLSKAKPGRTEWDETDDAALGLPIKLKHLKRDLINGGVEGLIERDVKDYRENSRIAHKKCNAITSAIAEVTDSQDYRVIVQALFEGGFLSTGDSDFSFDQLLGHVYGVKAYRALDAFHALHFRLMSEGMNGGENRYNTSGDNYYYAYEFPAKPNGTELSAVNMRSETRDPDDKGYREDVVRKVIVVENQSPAFAYILESSIFTGEPQKLHFVQLMLNYDDDLGLDELLACKFDISNVHEWSAWNDLKTRRIITTLDIQKMECTPIVLPKRIEYMLFNLYSGECSVEIDFKDSV